jgi:hypothetical protein
MVLKRSYLVTIALVLVLVVAAFAVAACGSEDTTTTTAATTATTAAPATDTTAAPATDTTGAAAASGTLVVKGMVDKPATFTVADLQKMSPVTITAEHPKKGATEYTGVKLADLFKTLGVQASATTLVMSSSDGYMAEAAISEIAAAADAMLAIGDGTLDMVMPGLSSKAWAKDVVSWEFK